MHNQERIRLTSIPSRTIETAYDVLTYLLQKQKEPGICMVELWYALMDWVERWAGVANRDRVYDEVKSLIARAALVPEDYDSINNDRELQTLLFTVRLEALLDRNVLIRAVQYAVGEVHGLHAHRSKIQTMNEYGKFVDNSEHLLSVSGSCNGD